MIRYSEIKFGPVQFLAPLTRLLTLSAAVYFFSFVTADPDLWGHIQFGKDLIRDGHLTPNDPYSFTAPGNLWINHEWLCELIFYGIYRYSGDAGLLLGKLGIGIAIVMLLTRLTRYRKNIPMVYAVVMILSISVVSPGFMIRPQIFSFLLFTLFFYLFYLYFEQEKNYLFLLPGLMLVWVNLHGGFLIGWVLMAAIVLWKTVTHLIGIEDGRGLGTLWIWFLLTCLATLVNPYGYKLHYFLFHSLSMPRNISEWAPLPLWDRSMLGFKILILLFVGCFIKYASKGKGWEIIGILLTLFASLRHQRHMPFFGIMVVPYLVVGLSTFLPDLERKFPKLVLTDISRYIFIFFLCFQTGYFMYQGTGRYLGTSFRIFVDPETYPVQAVRFMKTNNIKGNLLVPFEWGEYAIWKLYPDCKVSIDGRFRTVYPETVIRDHFIAADDREGWKALIQKYPSDILLARQLPFFRDLIKDQAEWVYVYSDSLAIVFIRNTVKNLKMLKQFRSGGYRYPKSAPSIYFP
jgi:hypothetical protein